MLKSHKPLPPHSRLLRLSLYSSSGLIHVGGRLQQSDPLESESIHPIVLKPTHHVTKFIIQDYDIKLHHPGSERLSAEIRRKFWILRGREAARQHQRNCVSCQKLRVKPIIPKMANLLAGYSAGYSSIYSIGIDCFGPYNISIGR